MIWMRAFSCKFVEGKKNKIKTLSNKIGFLTISTSNLSPGNERVKFYASRSTSKSLRSFAIPSTAANDLLWQLKWENSFYKTSEWNFREEQDLKFAVFQPNEAQKWRTNYKVLNVIITSNLNAQLKIDRGNPSLSNKTKI